MQDRWLWRSRWAALGAAVAVSLGGGGLFLANAAPGPNESTIVNVTPTRVLDTRDPVNLGLPGPFTSPASQKLQITGTVPVAGGGTATVVPTGATGVLLNVTAVSPTAAGFVSIRPGDAAGAPTTSSLNVETGSNIPNAVQVALPVAGANAGQIDITYDAYGQAGRTTELLIDIVGYTTNTGLQELVRSQPIASSAREGDVVPDPGGTAKVLVSTTITVPVAGLLQVVGSSLIFTAPASSTAQCSLSIGAGNTAANNGFEDTNRNVRTSTAGGGGTCGTNGAISVAAGTHVLNLVGNGAAGVDFDDSTIDVLFIAGGTISASDAAVAADESEK